MTFKLLSFSTALLFSVVISAQIPDNEKSALIDFYHATHGDSWTTKWALNTPVENWYGVEIVDNRVVGLIQYDNNLNGIIPPSIKTLEKLEVLDVALNNLQGELPAELTLLSKLKVVRLEKNGMTGSLPKDFSKMVNLEELIAFENNLEGGIPKTLAKAKNLRILNLSHNQLDGSLPDTLADLTQLNLLDLSANLFAGEVSLDFGRMQKLTELSLAFNSLTGNVPASVSLLSQLQILQLQGNEFDSFEGLQNMKSVYIDDFETDNLSLNLKYKKIFNGDYRTANTKFEDDDN